MVHTFIIGQLLLPLLFRKTLGDSVSAQGDHYIQAWQSSRIHSPDAVAGVQALATRLLGSTEAAGRFRFAKLPDQPTDVYTIDSDKDGAPLISGSSAVAIATGFYHYLKYTVNASVDQLGNNQLQLPSTLPRPRPQRPRRPQ